jgi:hypothetical protein
MRGRTTRLAVDAAGSCTGVVKLGTVAAVGLLLDNSGAPAFLAGKDVAVPLAVQRAPSPGAASGSCPMGSGCCATCCANRSPHRQGPRHPAGEGPAGDGPSNLPPYFVPSAEMVQGWREGRSSRAEDLRKAAFSYRSTATFRYRPEKRRRDLARRLDRMGRSQGDPLGPSLLPLDVGLEQGSLSDVRGVELPRNCLGSWSRASSIR